MPIPSKHPSIPAEEDKRRVGTQVLLSDNSKSIPHTRREAGAFGVFGEHFRVVATQIVIISVIRKNTVDHLSTWTPFHLADNGLTNGHFLVVASNIFFRVDSDCNFCTIIGFSCIQCMHVKYFTFNFHLTT
jgi:hypothetical protein